MGDSKIVNSLGNLRTVQPIVGSAVDYFQFEIKFQFLY